MNISSTQRRPLTPLKPLQAREPQHLAQGSAEEMESFTPSTSDVLIRGGKAMALGSLAGAAGSLGGMAAFYRSAFGTWGVSGMALQFPALTALGAGVGGAVATVVELGAGEGRQSNPVRSGLIGAGIGATLGFAIQTAVWAKCC